MASFGEGTWHMSEEGGRGPLPAMCAHLCSLVQQSFSGRLHEPQHGQELRRTTQ